MDNQESIRTWSDDVIKHYDEISSTNKARNLSPDTIAILAAAAAICNQMEHWGHKIEFQLGEIEKMLQPD